MSQRRLSPLGTIFILTYYSHDAKMLYLLYLSEARANQGATSKWGGTDRDNNLAEGLTLPLFIKKKKSLILLKKIVKWEAPKLVYSCQINNFIAVHNAVTVVQHTKGYGTIFMCKCVQIPYIFWCFFFIFYLLRLSATYSCIFTSDNSKHSYRLWNKSMLQEMSLLGQDDVNTFVL